MGRLTARKVRAPARAYSGMAWGFADCGCNWNPKMGFPLHAAGPLSGDGAWRFNVSALAMARERAADARRTLAAGRIRLHTRNVISKFALLAPDDLAAGSADGCAADCFARYHNAGHSRARRRVTADVFSALAFERWRLHFLNQRRIVAWGGELFTGRDTVHVCK